MKTADFLMFEAVMSIIDDSDCDELISRLAGPLSPPDRIALRRAAEEALARVPCWGEGAVYRAVVAVQRTFFDPSCLRPRVLRNGPARTPSFPSAEVL